MNERELRILYKTAKKQKFNESSVNELKDLLKNCLPYDNRLINIYDRRLADFPHYILREDVEFAMGRKIKDRDWKIVQAICRDGDNFRSLDEVISVVKEMKK
jgi:hypothetical protein